MRTIRSATLIGVAALALGAGGCGSSKKSKSSSSGNFHRGEFCSKHKKSTYKRAGFNCKKVHGTYRLQ
jgi:hypothetical protein